VCFRENGPLFHWRSRAARTARFGRTADDTTGVLPGGVVIGASGTNPGKQESTAVIERDFDGKELWRYDHAEQIVLDGRMEWAARQHHDWQREDFPSDYYSPDSKPGTAAVTRYS